MKISPVLLTVFAFSALVAAGSASAANTPATPLVPANPNLVVNGSFEANTFNGSFTQLSAVNGWTSSNGVFELQKGANQGGISGFMPNAADGIQYLELNNNNLSSVSQNLATKAGGLYSLSFSFAGRPDTPNQLPSLINVYWGNTLLNPSPLVGTDTGSWQNFSLSTLTAQGALTSLRFESVGPTGAPTFGSYLDNVTVTAVPEPESYAMLLPGLALVGFMARRKKAA
ncbi:FxDxF family PEP-CTERM protein [Janthinobacterium agaricidamnosum]|uniref:PEP-CTERM putative exosortase interaction domain protein n=1 Tax=Janthinobacterium agaricidamnosum NBRC 102515 = DSM 9628 TaxID=1349767 RepID=W0VAH7_9BURK|nr:FxDxF family PEP-CTERM protein [Janthinobacterium agaricidamnosum]CDG84886.1 PEP-CTERM putative exosortase interaction domain protein [Janthinobacterium agaricidamnosum NBRC 102515 = DSM 9628]